MSDPLWLRSLDATLRKAGANPNSAGPAEEGRKRRRAGAIALYGVKELRRPGPVPPTPERRRRAGRAPPSAAS